MISQVAGVIFITVLLGSVFTSCQEKKAHSISTYHSNGKLAAQGDTVDGHFKTWHSNGQVRSQCEYRRGLIQGVFLMFDSTGKKMFEHHYKNGQWDGQIQSWYEGSDVMEFETEYSNGKINGSFKSFYPNGNIKFINHFKNGLRNGVWHFYDSSGQLQKVEEYINNVLISPL